MAILINGNGNKAIWAAQDADLIASLAGNVTGIAAVGNQFAATQEDASTIGLADGVIITKEGRRIQLDTGEVDLFTIPTGTAGVTSYYIIGYKLSQQSDTSQICETFVQKMSSASETIDEDTFKSGATEVYVSCYRVTQVGLNIDTITALLISLGDIQAIKTALTDFSFRDNNGVDEYSSDGGATWNKLGGNNMVVLDTANPIHSFTTGHLSFTATQDCYLFGVLASDANNSTANIKINNVVYFRANGSSATNVGPFKLVSGDAVVVANVPASKSDDLHICLEKTS